MRAMLLQLCSVAHENLSIDRLFHACRAANFWVVSRNTVADIGGVCYSIPTKFHINMSNTRASYVSGSASVSKRCTACRRH